VPQTAPEFRPRQLLRTLVAHDVDFVLVGGMAAMTHGSAYPSFDVDIAYARDDGNLERLVRALRELRATLRGAPTDVPFQLDAQTLRAGAQFTFATPFGALDILDKPDGAPPYDELKDAAVQTSVEGESARVASIDHLIAMKQATDRPHDKVVAAELRAISDELRAR
jgi:hypothetical protein